MAAGSRRAAPCRHQSPDAGWLRRRDRGRTGIDQPLDWICPLLAIDTDAFNHGGTPEFAAISAVVRRHNDISHALDRSASVQADLRRKPVAGSIRPWCRGFYAAMRLRMLDWAPLLDTSDVNHGLLLPILLHCRDDQGRPLLGPTRRGRETREFLRNAHGDIPAVVEAMRQYWMPTRYARAS